MKNVLLLLLMLANYLMYGQVIWQETNTGTSCTISVGEFSVWDMTDPTLNGGELPTGALIGVFFINSRYF